METKTEQTGSRWLEKWLKRRLVVKWYMKLAANEKWQMTLTHDEKEVLICLRNQSFMIVRLQTPSSNPVYSKQGFSEISEYQLWVNGRIFAQCSVNGETRNIRGDALALLMYCAIPESNIHVVGPE